MELKKYINIDRHKSVDRELYATTTHGQRMRRPWLVLWAFVRLLRIDRRRPRMPVGYNIHLKWCAWSSSLVSSPAPPEITSEVTLQTKHRVVWPAFYRRECKTVFVDQYCYLPQFARCFTFNSFNCRGGHGKVQEFLLLSGNERSHNSQSIWSYCKRRNQSGIVTKRKLRTFVAQGDLCQNLIYAKIASKLGTMMSSGGVPHVVVVDFM